MSSLNISCFLFSIRKLQKISFLIIELSNLILINPFLVNQKTHPLNEDSTKLFKKVYNPKDKQFIKCFTDLFISYTKDFKLQKIFETLSSKEFHSLSLIREQTLILENILNYSICFDICSSASYLVLFENLIKTNFNGYLNYVLADRCSEETRALYVLYAQTLSDISFLFIANTITLGAVFLEKSNLTQKIYDQNFQEMSANFLFFTEKNLEFLRNFIYKTELLQQQGQDRIGFSGEAADEYYGYSYFNKIVLFIFFYVCKSIETMENAIAAEKKLGSAIKDNENLVKNLKQKIEKNFISFKELKELNIDNNYFTLTINYLNSVFDRDILSHEKYGYHIQYRAIVIQVANLVISEKYLGAENEMLPAKNNDLKKIVELIEKIYDNPSVLRNFWAEEKVLSKEPILNLLFKFINQFPINIDLLLKMYFCLLKYKENVNSRNSNNILEILLDMRMYTCSCYEEELEILEDEEESEEKENEKLKDNLNLNKNEEKNKDANFEKQSHKENGFKVRLLADKLNEIIRIPAGQIGKTFDEGKIKLVTFFIRYSIYDFLFLKWDKVNEYISQLNSYTGGLNNPNITNALDEYHFTCTEYLRLFCDFISNAEENIDLYLSNKFADLISEKAATEEYTKIISAAFTSLSLLGQNKNLYNSLHAFVNSTYNMLYSLIKKQEDLTSNLLFMKIFVAKFINNNNNYAETANLSHAELIRFSAAGAAATSIPSIFFSTIYLDNHFKNFENTLLILKMSRRFFKAPIVFELLKNPACAEFLESLWTKVISELAKVFYDFENIKDEQIKILNALISIVNELLNLITLSACKTQLIATEHSNCLEKLLVFCLNSIDLNRLLLPVLKTDVLVERELMHQSVFMENYLDKTCVREKIGFLEHKKNVKKLIRNALRNLNLIFSNLISFKTLSNKQQLQQQTNKAAFSTGASRNILEDSDDTLKVYQALDFIKIWDEIFYTSKNFVANEVRHGSKVYSVNLIISLFSYFQFEIEKNYPFEYADTIIFFGLRDAEKLEKYLIDYRNYDDKYFNVGELAVSAVNKVIVLLKFGAQNQIGNLIGNAAYLSGNVKAINILNYLYLKKENTSELDASVNLFENFKDMIFGLLSTDSFSLKIQILQFLILVSNSQQGFISMLMDDSKNRPTKVIYKFSLSV